MSADPTLPLKDRVAMVTGGAGGIGLESAKALQTHGATVVISDLHAKRGEKAAQEFGLEFFPADVTNSAQVRHLAQHVLNHHGRLDIAFNNAGIAYSVPSEDCTDEEWLKVININLTAVFYCCREFGNIMLRQERGSIINSASMSGLISPAPIRVQCGQIGRDHVDEVVGGRMGEKGCSRQQHFAGLYQHPNDAQGPG
jgi:NAD(P)-dependent dehydrogenase (short-subunit alcohol dehydrogenase family)